MTHPTARSLKLGLGPQAERVVTRSNWTLPPYNRWSFMHVQELTRTCRVARSNAPVALPHSPIDLSNLAYVGGAGEPRTVAQMLDETWTDGFIVLAEGQIVTELYFNDMAPETLHLMMSCSKSFTAAAVGIAVSEGHLDLSKRITHYLPELAGSGFDGATVQQALDMQVGIQFDEDYDNLDGEWRDLEIATGWRDPEPGDTVPTDMVAYMQTLARNSEHGSAFHYQSVLTDAVGVCLERATGKPFASYFREKVWQPLGTEHDLVTIIDNAGYAVFEGGFNCSLRDFGRFANMICECAGTDGAGIVPASWINQTRYAGADLVSTFARSEYAELMPGHAYHNGWWIRDPARGVMMGLGIHGQNLYVDPERRVAIAKFSSQPAHVDPVMALDQFLAFDAIASHLG